MSISQSLMRVVVRKWALFILVAAMPIASASAAHHGRHGHSSQSRHHSHGIDVSHHQGHIAWHKLRRQGVDFAYIKATEGADHIDRRFSSNWHAAHAAGVRRGAYHFFTLCRSGRDQAKHFVRHVPADASALPPAVDLEFPGNCPKRPSRAKFNKELRDFLRIVEARYGKHAVLYLTPHFDKRYRVSATFHRPLWLRSIGSKPRFGARHWTIWQASSSRKLQGVRGRVDWNISRA